MGFNSAFKGLSALRCLTKTQMSQASWLAIKQLSYQCRQKCRVSKTGEGNWPIWALYCKSTKVNIKQGRQYTYNWRVRVIFFFSAIIAAWFQLIQREFLYGDFMSVGTVTPTKDFARFWPYSDFLERCPLNSAVPKVTDIRPVGVALILKDRQTNGRDETIRILFAIMGMPIISSGIHCIKSDFWC
jgi:hypothetical protein